MPPCRHEWWLDCSGPVADPCSTEFEEQLILGRCLDREEGCLAVSAGGGAGGEEPGSAGEADLEGYGCAGDLCCV